MPNTPAGRLVDAFGNPAQMREMYSDRIKWWLPKSMSNVPHPLDGIEAVSQFNTYVWTDLYRADCTVEVLAEIGNEELSAVRFIYRAYNKLIGQNYENSYTLFVKKGDDGIFEVFEDIWPRRKARRQPFGCYYSGKKQRYENSQGPYPIAQGDRSQPCNLHP